MCPFKVHSTGCSRPARRHATSSAIGHAHKIYGCDGSDFKGDLHPSGREGAARQGRMKISTFSKLEQLVVSRPSSFARGARNEPAGFRRRRLLCASFHFAGTRHEGSSRLSDIYPRKSAKTDERGAASIRNGRRRAL
ncbi:hypothetical protein SKAU_G00013110 [Synaphobranchus kaupii]|uniref:Uncharacterized protein n=1 Tax=Synaphobranchus kaupii TaxID=118154 RepID=A0A9Q1JCD5_SYNKA|nr:hypothetical protein SKAU_G00013110 [Synaphobranchus kaupii]